MKILLLILLTSLLNMSVLAQSTDSLLWDFSGKEVLQLWHKNRKGFCHNINSENTLKLQQKSKDAFIYIPKSDVGKIMQIESAKRRYIVIKAKCSADDSFLHQVYWKTKENPNLSEKSRINYFDKPEDRIKITDSDGYSTIIFDMSNYNNWMNETVTDLRFDIYNGGKTADRTVDVKWIKITGAYQEPLGNFFAKNESGSTGEDTSLLFDFSDMGVLERWSKSGKGFCDVIKSGKNLKLHIKSKDAFIYMPDVELTKIDKVTASKRKYVIMKARCTRDGSFLHQIYWRTKSNPTMSEKTRINVFDKLNNRKKLSTKTGIQRLFLICPRMMTG